MSDLTDLYQTVILDHNRRPRNRGKLPTATRVASGDNPTCGDQCTVYLRMDGNASQKSPLRDRAAQFLRPPLRS